MAKGSDYIIEPLYQGGYSTFKPDYGDKEFFTGYHMPARDLSLTTDPRVANVLQEVSSKLSTGVKQIEVSAVSPEIFESVPKQHLKEINRLSKLTGVDVSVHAPVVEPSGFTQQGFSESSRNAIERQMKQFVERAHEINPDGNIPVVFHSSAGLPSDIVEKNRMLIINKDTGQMNAISIEPRHYPGREDIVKGRVESPEDQIKIANLTDWDNSLSQITFYKEGADRILSENAPLINHLIKDLKENKIDFKNLKEPQRKAFGHMENAETYLQNVQQYVNSLFDKAYKFGTEEQKTKLIEISEEYRGILENINPYDVKEKSDVIQNLIHTLKNPILTPEVIQSLNNFTKEKSTETFANVALNAYDKFKNKAPIIAIENPPAGSAFSTGEELKGIVEESRKKFVERAIKPKDQKGLGMSKSEAEEQAKKLIGATWDVGHINMLRKYGYESKDIIKETEKIAPFVKHVHLSDNFGFEHTELPMGMGNVPVKEMMERLGKEGFEGKKIIEAASWWQHFKTPPIKESLQAFGSPIYSMQMAPYWNQSIGFQQDYYSGLGMTFPQINYETFGAGFSQLPLELGGQRPGAQGSRMSGKGME